jgi:hypothetical protein
MLLECEIAWTKNSRLELYNSPEVQNYYYQFFYESNFGNKLTECAAWIIHANDGYSLVKWPTIKQIYKQVWTLPIPSGAVAIAHTHPTIDSEKPSKTDALTAKKLNLPIYTISRSGVWKVTPSGFITRVKNRNWRKKIEARCTINHDGELKCTAKK